MAVLGTTVLTYADWAKRVEDGYRIGTIIELLSQTNEILLDMLVLEGNLPTGHKTTVRTGRVPIAALMASSVFCNSTRTLSSRIFPSEGCDQL